MIGLMRRVIRQFNIGQQRRQKEPTALVAIEQQRVLSNPTQPSQLSKLPLQQRRRIHDAAHARLRHAIAQETPPTDRAARESNRGSPPRPMRIATRVPAPRRGVDRLRRSIIHRQHDDAAHAVQHAVRIAVRLAPIGQIVHLAGVPGRQPFIEPGRPGGATAGHTPHSEKPNSLACRFSSWVNFRTIHFAILAAGGGTAIELIPLSARN